MNSYLKFFTVSFGIFLMTQLSPTVNAQQCPAQFAGEYRKLHSDNMINLCDLAAGKVTLVINTASHCGFTSQFEGLEALYKKYKDRGLVMIGFASDDFKQEAKDEGEAAGICFENFGVTFTMLAPTHVKGPEANTLFQFLAKETSAPKWNFYKYLLDKNGNVIDKYSSVTKPNSSSLNKAIEKALK